MLCIRKEEDLSQWLLADIQIALLNLVMFSLHCFLKHCSYIYALSPITLTQIKMSLSIQSDRQQASESRNCNHIS
jgi:hypothetical protein